MIQYTYVSKNKGVEKKTEISNIRDLYKSACDEVGIRMTDHPKFKNNISHQLTTTMTPEKLQDLFECTLFNVSLKFIHKNGKVIDYFKINK